MNSPVAKENYLLRRIGLIEKTRNNFLTQHYLFCSTFNPLLSLGLYSVFFAIYQLFWNIFLPSRSPKTTPMYLVAVVHVTEYNR